LEVASVALLFRVRLEAHRRPFVAMVNVTAAVGLNCTLLNSATPRFANVMMRETAELKVTVPVPADHDPLVEEFVQAPLKVHVTAPKLKNPVAAMLMLPLIDLAPAAPEVIPPAMLAPRAATVSANVLVARIAPALTVSVPPTSTRAVCVTLPVAAIVRLLKLLAAFWVAMLLTPVIVTVLVPFVKVEPAPLVFQFPESVRDAVVSVIVPLVPPVIATLETLIVDAFAVRIPPSPTLKAPPVKPRLAVARAVDDDPSEMTSVPPQFRTLVDIVNVCAVAALELNVTLLNSLPERFAPANVIVPPVALLNVTVPVPAPHDADVEAFVHVPVTVHVDEFRARYPFAALMSTFPLIETADAFAVRAPNVDTVSPPVVIPKLAPDVVRIVDPVAPPVEFRIVSVPPNRSALVAIVYVMLVVTVASNVRLLNSFVAPAKAPKVRVPLAASRMVTLLVPATQPAAVDRLVQVPLTVHVDAPRRTTVVAVTTFTLPVTVTVELRALNVP